MLGLVQPMLVVEITPLSSGASSTVSNTSAEFPFDHDDSLDSRPMTMISKDPRDRADDDVPLTSPVIAIAPKMEGIAQSSGLSPTRRPSAPSVGSTRTSRKGYTSAGTPGAESSLRWPLLDRHMAGSGNGPALTSDSSTHSSRNPHSSKFAQPPSRSRTVSSESVVEELRLLQQRSSRLSISLGSHKWELPYLSWYKIRRFISNPFSVPPHHSVLRKLSAALVWSLILYGLALLSLSDSLRPGLSFVRSRTGDDHIISSKNLLLSPYYPEPPPRPGDEHLNPDPRWRPFHPLPPPSAPFPRLRPVPTLPDECLESWLVEGEMMCPSKQLGDEEKLDVTWTWVNGSDPKWKDTLIEYRDKQGVASPEHHWRENNELKYSVRSVLDSMPGRIRNIHLIVADFPFSSDTDLPLLPAESLPELEKAYGERVKPDPRPLQRRGTPQAGNLGSLERIHVHQVDDQVTADGLITAQSETRSRKSGLGTAASEQVRETLNKTWRIAQVPTWLAMHRANLGRKNHPYHRFHVDSVKDDPSHLHITSHPSLHLASHTEIFHIPSHNRNSRDGHLGSNDWEEAKWLKAALPTFNSMAIESRIGWVPGLADATLALNDDFFLLKPHAAADFHSMLYGSVFRFDHSWNSQILPKLDKSWINDAGEMGGLFHANWLLSQRFPRRPRPYFAHAPKVVTRSMHHEAALMFENALTLSSTRRFRELPIGQGDVQIQWLTTHLKVERWREALLWTWIVARVGSLAEGGDVWADEARHEVMDLFGITEADDDVFSIEVHRGERWTTEADRIKSNFENLGWESPMETEVLWSSMDGHLPPPIAPGLPADTNNRCKFDLERCLGSFWSRGENVSSTDMFKRLTFANPQCGDCLSMALITASGPLGLSAFFPLPGTTYTIEKSQPRRHPDAYVAPPHLPLTPTWQEADFSLRNVLPETGLPGETTDLRKWCLKLLSRYLYVSGRSRSLFHMLLNPRHAREVFTSLETYDKDGSILGLNDDINESYEETRDIMLEWFEQRWPHPAVWERDWTRQDGREAGYL